MVIDDPFLRYVNGGDTGSVRFDFFDFVAIEFAQTFQAVGIAAFPESFEAGHFVWSGGNDDFATLLVRNLVIAAEREHLLETADGEFGFVGTGFVIEPSVKDAAVVAGLMLAERRFLFEEQEFCAGACLKQLPSGS